MVDVQINQAKQGFDWTGFDNLVSLQIVPDISTPTTVSVAYARRPDPKQPMQLQGDDQKSMTSSNDRGNEIVSKLPLSALKMLVIPIEQGIIDMQTVFYLKNERDTERIAINVEDFLQIVHRHVSSIAKRAGLTEDWYENEKGSEDEPQRLQDLKRLLEKLTNYEDSDGYATLLPTQANGDTIGIIGRLHEPSYSSVTPLSAQEKIGIEMSIQLHNKRTWFSGRLKLKIASLLTILFLLAVFLALGLYLGLGQRSNVPYFSTTTTNIPVTTPTNSTQITDCYDWRHKLGYEKSGIYTIYPNGIKPFAVYCDMVTDGGGWTVFQKRQDNSLVFWNRSWADYKNGFDNGLERNTWLGLERIHLLSTKDASVTMRIDLWGNRDLQQTCDPVDAFLFGEWDFNIENETNQYRLHLMPWKAGNLSYPGDDYLQLSNNQPFSTIDHDNSLLPWQNFSLGCPSDQDSPSTPYNWGAWWYNRSAGCCCFYLNGKYDPPRTGYAGFACLHTSIEHPVNGTHP